VIGSERAKTVHALDRATTVTGSERARTVHALDRSATVTGSERTKTVHALDRLATVIGIGFQVSCYYYSICYLNLPCAQQLFYLNLHVC
jgi:hypothetical protein